jgi:hypothetical protein
VATTVGRCSGQASPSLPGRVVHGIKRAVRPNDSISTGSGEPGPLVDGGEAEVTDAAVATRERPLESEDASVLELPEVDRGLVSGEGSEEAAEALRVGPRLRSGRSQEDQE